MHWIQSVSGRRRRSREDEPGESGELQGREEKQTAWGELADGGPVPSAKGVEERGRERRRAAGVDTGWKPEDGWMDGWMRGGQER